jgi:hypothetical protein
MGRQTHPRGPDFLVIGAQRSGTTWLHLVLRQHPQLWLPAVKELHYFDKPVHRSCLRLEDWPRIGWVGLNSFDPWLLRYFFGARNDEWYMRLFQKAQARGLTSGEVTPAYGTLAEDVFARIRDMNPDVKLVFIMRDPVDRAWSAANLAAKSGYFDGPLTEEKALIRAHSPGWVSRSSYMDTIRRLEKIFPALQLQYCFFDELRDRPSKLAAAILAFLGVDPAKVSDMVLPDAVNAAAAGKAIPSGFERTMARECLPMVQELCRRFEGAPHVWRARYEALLNSSNQH